MPRPPNPSTRSSPSWVGRGVDGRRDDGRDRRSSRSVGLEGKGKTDAMARTPPGGCAGVACVSVRSTSPTTSSQLPAADLVIDAASTGFRGTFRAPGRYPGRLPRRRHPLGRRSTGPAERAGARGRRCHRQPSPRRSPALSKPGLGLAGRSWVADIARHRPRHQPPGRLGRRSPIGSLGWLPRRTSGAARCGSSPGARGMAVPPCCAAPQPPERGSRPMPAPQHPRWTGRWRPRRDRGHRAARR